MEVKRYVALLRGINISGKNKVPMAELKKLYDAMFFVTEAHPTEILPMHQEIAE